MRTQGGHREMMGAALAGARADEARARRRSDAAERAWAAGGTMEAREAFRAAQIAWTEAAAELVEIEAEVAEAELAA